MLIVWGGVLFCWYCSWEIIRLSLLQYSVAPAEECDMVRLGSERVGVVKDVNGILNTLLSYAQR